MKALLFGDNQYLSSRLKNQQRLRTDDLRLTMQAPRPMETKEKEICKSLQVGANFEGIEGSWGAV